jgi:RNA-directed DNA polymerase
VSADGGFASQKNLEEGKKRGVKDVAFAKRKTAKDRFGRAMKRVAECCRANRHLPVREQHQGLTLKLRRHFQYYGIIGNSQALKRFLFEVKRVWHKRLNRRSQRGNMPWDPFNRFLDQYSFPYPRFFHPAVCLSSEAII